ncbi:MAG: hypothetical protein ABFS23_11330 [Pseudomonadota bacterium]
MSETYKPVSCGLYDELEAAATNKIEVSIYYKSENGSKSIRARITDLRIQEGAEYAVLDTGEAIRLDRITGLSPVAGKR